jgi:asparagine synthase (glutamine-hydrolysing)
VVQKWNIHAHYLTYEEHLSAVDFEQINHYFDVAYSPTLLFLAPVLRNAQQKGVRIMLDGIGGDDLLAVDIDHLTDLILKGNIYKLMVQLRHDSILYSRSPYSLFLNYCLKPLIPRPMKVTIRTLLKPFRSNGIPSWINATFLKKNGVIDRMKSKQNFKRFPTRAQQHIYETLRFGWNANIALDMLERFTAHFDIESRHPFFDRRLVEFLLAVPEEQRWRGKWPKAVLRQAMDGILPERIKMRKDKAKFSCVLNLEYKERQYHKVKELIQKSHIAAIGAIHTDCLQQLFESYCCGKAPDSVINILEKFLWLELWYRPAMGEP